MVNTIYAASVLGSICGICAEELRMGKRLQDMTLEELWQLFPIVISPHSDGWKEWYEEESARLKNALAGHGVKLHHVGSTAIEGICAKPIVDILAEAGEGEDVEELAEIIAENGYICMSEGEGRKSFNRGYTEDGFAERVFHLHLRRAGDNDELYFRDYLNRFPAVAEEYAALKLGLAERFRRDRDGYTAAKGDFVKKYTAIAKALYRGRY